MVGLRAQLAAVTKERDALRADNATLLANADADALMGTQVGRERDAFKARVAALEAALERSPCDTVRDALCSAGLGKMTLEDVRKFIWVLRRCAGLDAKEGD